MKITIIALASVAALTTASLAHEGHAHQMLGTVERTRACHFVMKTQQGESKTIFLSPTTKLERSGAPVSAKDLTPGTRVSVTVEDDGETAVTVNAGGAK